MLRYCSLLFVTVLALGSPASAQPGQTPAPTPADLATGQLLFVQHCGSCHGPTGSGGRGADLARPQLAHADTDAALRRLIREGIAGTEMPGSFQLTDEEIVKVAAFVRTLGRVAPEATRGDATRGAEIYQARCAGCHYLNGSGGVTGPAMTGIGSRRGASWLRAKLLDPAANVPDTFRMVDLTPRGGQRVTGVRVNEDTTSIQVREMSGRVRSFWKSDLASLTTRAGQTPMSSYRSTLTEAQLDDLVAFLASQTEGKTEGKKEGK